MSSHADANLRERLNRGTPAAAGALQEQRASRWDVIGGEDFGADVVGFAPVSEPSLNQFEDAEVGDNRYIPASGLIEGHCPLHSTQDAIPKLTERFPSARHGLLWVIDVLLELRDNLLSWLVLKDS